MVSSIASFYSLEASSIPLVVTIKMTLDIIKMSLLGDQNCELLLYIDYNLRKKNLSTLLLYSKIF